MISEKKGKLLIVDDEEDIREVLKLNLENFMEEVDTAFDGQDAWEKVSKKKYDAILTDIKMPRMTGLTFLKKIRENGDYTPVIILTGFGDKQMTIEALHLGAMDFLDKPCDVSVIKGVVDKAIELGMELNHWGHDSDEATYIEDVQKDSAKSSMRKLGQVAENLAKENIALKKALEKKGTK